MNIINLTPHTIRVEVGEATIAIPASGTVARCQTIEVSEPDVNGLPVVSQRFGEIEGLPEPVKGSIYLVSMVVGNAVVNGAGSSRFDVYGPNTSPGSVVRDANGQIAAVRSLVRYLPTN
jgi:hypothetical protein